MSTRHTFLGGVAVLLAAAAGCYTGGSALDGAVGAAGRAPGNGTTTIAEGTEPAAKVTGLPCEMANVIATCAACHGERPSGGAPNRMLSYDDLTSRAASDGELTVAQVTLARMRDTKNPMPPSGASPEQIAIVAAWLAAGMPAGTCEAIVGGPVASEYDTPLVCTSQKHWTLGERKSPEMHPGVACIDCHAQEREAPSFAAAGTVYPTAHEPDDCNGIDDGKKTTVEITDATGRIFRQTVNAAGNFYFETKTNAIAMPYTAKVISGTKTRAMKDAVDTGDCNACHTENGMQGAPGRVMAP